jgi:hypothetical protein
MAVLNSVEPILGALRKVDSDWRPVDPEFTTEAGEPVVGVLSACGALWARHSFEVWYVPRLSSVAEKAVVTINVTGDINRTPRDAEAFAEWLYSEAHPMARGVKYASMGPATHWRTTTEGETLQGWLSAGDQDYVIRDVSRSLRRKGPAPRYERVYVQETEIVEGTAETGEKAETIEKIDIDGIPAEHRSCGMTKTLAARYHAGQKIENGTDYFNNHPEVTFEGQGRTWYFDVTQFPESVREKMKG